MNINEYKMLRKIAPQYPVKDDWGKNKQIKYIIMKHV